MSVRTVLGLVIAVPSMFGMHLLWLSAAILHFYTAFVAYGLAGPGFWGFAAAGAAFAFPLVAEVAVLIGAWNVSGSFVNGYSFWLFAWLFFVALLGGLIFLGTWLANSGKD